MGTVSLPVDLRARLREVTRRKGITVSDVHRLALERHCADELPEPAANRYDDVIGVVDGPEGGLSAHVSDLFAAAMMRKHGGHAG